MRLSRLVLIGIFAQTVLACSAPISDFGVYRQSDGTVGVHAPKGASDTEAHEAAVVECKTLGKRTATIVTAHPTSNDRFPNTYIYSCTY
jgi:hypothetical protein